MEPKKPNKTKPIGVRLNIAQFEFIKWREKIETAQGVINFLIDEYYWRFKIPSLQQQQENISHTMKPCLMCQNLFTYKKPSAKFCSVNCRVLWNRKNGKRKEITVIQMQVLYNSILKLLADNNITPK